jgi:hypothetical protein
MKSLLNVILTPIPSPLQDFGHHKTLALRTAGIRGDLQRPLFVPRQRGELRRAMLRPTGRFSTGLLAAFMPPIPLQRIPRHDVLCLRTFSSSPSIQSSSSVSEAERKKLIRDAKKGKRIKLTRLADIPEDIGYLGRSHIPILVFSYQSPESD